MSRLRLIAVLTVIAALAAAGVASAAGSARRVTGGTTTLTLSSAAAKALSDNHLTIAPLAPATASGSTLSFPIARGRLNSKLHGFVDQRGGFTISNGSKTARLRRLTVVSSDSGVALRALVAKTVRARHGRFVVRYYDARIARITGAKVSNSQATGTLRLTAVSAAIINRLAGTHLASAGEPIGTTSVAPTFS